MRGTWTVRRAIEAAACAGAAALTLSMFSSSAHALSGNPVTLVGVVSCDATTGHQLVAWTLANPSGTSLTIDSANVDGSGLSAGSPIDLTATLTPNPVANGGSATGDTAASGDAVGDLHLVVSYSYADFDPIVDGEVVLPGGCVPAVSTSTTLATTTSRPAARAAAVAASPAFTG